MKRIVVIGLGYVGIPLVNLAASKGFSVIGIDINGERLKELAEGTCGDGLCIQPGYLNKRVVLTPDFANVSLADIIVICVPTPVTKKYTPDLKPLLLAAKSIGPFIRRGQTVALESTVNPGVTEQKLIPIMNRLSKLHAGREYFVAHCPERINPGDPYWHVGNIPRVIGGLNESSLERAAEFYNALLDSPVKKMASIGEAEAVKIVENSFRDINIAFVNELARSFARMNIDTTSVIEGASTKPFGFMPHYPGLGVGGHCIPVDPYYLIEEARANGFYHDFLALARRINNDMPRFVFENLEQALNEHNLPLKGTRVALLGLSYKADVGDIRQSPSLSFLKMLEQSGAAITAYDPHVHINSPIRTLAQAVRGAKAIVLATGHKEFKALDFNELRLRGLEIVVDGRNFFDKRLVQAAGLTYTGVGR